MGTHPGMVQTRLSLCRGAHQPRDFISLNLSLSLAVMEEWGRACARLVPGMKSEPCKGDADMGTDVTHTCHGVPAAGIVPKERDQRRPFENL